jgi:hypothetical protein
VSNSNGASKSHKNPYRKNTNFHLKSPTTIKNQQSNEFPNQNPILSTPTKTKNKPRENREATITEFEKGEACESN